MIPTIIVRSYSDNVAYLRLKNKGNPVNIRGLSSVLLCTDTGSKINSYDHPDVFRWTDLPRGVLELKLGHIDFGSGIVNANLSVYDGLHLDGLFFGSIRLRTIKGCS